MKAREFERLAELWKQGRWTIEELTEMERLLKKFYETFKDYCSVESCDAD